MSTSNTTGILERDFQRMENSPYVQSYAQLQSDFNPTFYQVIESQMQQVTDLFSRIADNSGSIERWHIEKSIENMTDTLGIAKNRISQGKDSLVTPAGLRTPIRLEQFITGDMRVLSPDQERTRIKTWNSFVKLVGDLEKALSELELRKLEAEKPNEEKCYIS